MIIGYDASRAFSTQRTGTENYAFQILKHLAQIDQSNQYYVFTRPQVDLYASQARWPDNFYFVTVPYPRLWTQFGLATQTFGKYKMDVLFVPSHTLPILRRPGLKTVITVHDLGAEYLPKTHQLKQRLYLNFMTHHQLKSASKIIAVSQSTKDDLVKRTSIPEDKISVIYEGYDQQLFQPVNQRYLSEKLNPLGLTLQSYFLFIGTVQPRKNLERLMEAYAQFLDKTKQKDPPKLAIAGSKGWLSDPIYELPKQLGIESHITFLGYVPNELLPTLYSGAKALVFPSLFEGFGLPIVEAFACNCPVLTSKVSSMPEIAGNAAILVDPYSVEEISRGLMKISSDPRLVKELIEKGRKRVVQFSWEKAAQATIRILTEAK